MASPKAAGANYNRYKYYQKLKTTAGHIANSSQGSNEATPLTLPTHMFDAYLIGFT